MRWSLVRNAITIAAIAYTLFLGYMCLVPVPFMEDMPQDSDKWMHALAYVAFGIIWFLFFYYTEVVRVTQKRAILLSIILGLVYGTVIELAQSYLTTYRSGDYRDMIANATGLLLAAGALVLLARPLKSIKSKL